MREWARLGGKIVETVGMSRLVGGGALSSEVPREVDPWEWDRETEVRGVGDDHDSGIERKLRRQSAARFVV